MFSPKSIPRSTLRRRVTPAAVLLLALVPGAAGCGGDPKQIRVGAGPPEAVLAQLEHRKGLTVEETRLLHGYFARTRLGFIEGTAADVTGRTVGELIAEQRRWEQEHRTVIAERQQHAAQWKARADGVVAEMEQNVSVRLLETRDAEGELAGGAHRSVVVKLELSNRSGRTLSEVEGAVRFTDVWDRDVFDCTVTIREPIVPGETVQRAVLLDCTPFVGQEVRVRQIRLQDTKSAWEPRRVAFEDGTALTMPDE